MSSSWRSFSLRRGANGRSSTMNGIVSNTSGEKQSGGSGGGGQDSAISSSDYARRRRQLMVLYKDLRAFGTNDSLKSPTITVIGGQSAGKSSLVEAVSGINVPRDSGTCTRCPMECTMSSESETWSCQISIRLDYNAQGAKNEPPITHAFGSILTDKSAVELWLRRAQAAILHPHLSYQNFYTKTEEQLRNPPADDARLAFSRNAVLVELRDPELTDLGFVDLPGLIQNETAEAIGVVRDLTVSRINGRDTLILVTIPMSDDVQNQEAARLAREADSAGVRTIAVLTKPDLLGPGATGLRSAWTDVLEGRRHKLKHGYYCVRLPDDAERTQGITKTESERRAAEYFDTTQPWRDIADRSRFGVPNLSACLSKLLINRLEASLPELRQQVTKLLERFTDALSRLPPPPVSEPAADVLLRVAHFCQAFSAAVYGSTKYHKSFVQNNKERYRQFQADIQSTVPDFRPFSGHSNYRKPDIETFQARVVEVVGGETVVPRGPLDFLDVREVIASSVTWELPNHVPFVATKTLVSRFTDQWRKPSIACFQAVVESASVFLSNELMPKHFDQFFLLKDYVWSLTSEELERCRGEALKTLEKMLPFELDPLFTQNTKFLLSEADAWRRKYEGVFNHSAAFLLPTNDHMRYQAEFPGGPFDDELTLMAKVRAYWQIGYQRIIDYVPLLIEHEFNQRLARRLQEILFAELLRGPDVSTKMQEFLAEDPAVCAERVSLKNQIDRLLEIKQKLDGLSC